MLTPIFKLEQDDKFIIITIKLPYVKISTGEFYTEKYQFKFFLKPYLLTLNFKQQLKEEEYPESAVYTYESKELIVKLKKAQECEFFEDLDMITKLFDKSQQIQKPKKKTKKPLIEVIGETNTQEIDQENNLIQEIKLTSSFEYGFNKLYSDVFTDFWEEVFELFEINPESSNYEERLQLRQRIQQQEFDPDRYLADTFENEDIDYLIKNKQLALLQDIQQIIGNLTLEEKKQQDLYTKEEWDCLVRLPNKEYIILNKQTTLYEIFDITYAYLYEYRIQDGDFSCESALNINRLSSTLSCCVVDSILEDCVKTCLQRSLIYPLYRKYDLSIKILEDLVNVFGSGRLQVLKIFLKIKNLFERSEPRYLLNTIYIDDFCVYIQQLKEVDLIEIANNLKKIKITKGQLNLGLDELEQEAIELMKEVEEEENAESDEEQ